MSTPLLVLIRKLRLHAVALHRWRANWNRRLTRGWQAPLAATSQWESATVNLNQRVGPVWFSRSPQAGWCSTGWITALPLCTQWRMVAARHLAANTLHCLKDNMFSYRRETAQHGAFVLAKSERLELGDNKIIFYGHYRSIFNHCDIVGLQSYGIRWKKRIISAITAFKVIQGHRGRYQSKARMRIPISD